jgi:hypothetical protein
MLKYNIPNNVMPMFRTNSVTIGINEICVPSEGKSHRKAPENTDPPFSGDQNICLTTKF